MATATKSKPKVWRNRIVGSGEEAPDQLVANPRNWRTHPGPQRDALRGSLGAIGWVQQVIVNTKTGHVVDGHARIEEALSSGAPTVPVLYVELEPDEEALVLATLDPIAALAVADEERLADLISEIAVDDAALSRLIADLTGEEVHSADVLPAKAQDGYREQYGVIVICADEREQERVYNRLSEDGYRVRVVTT